MNLPLTCLPLFIVLLALNLSSSQSRESTSVSRSASSGKVVQKEGDWLSNLEQLLSNNDEDNLAVGAIIFLTLHLILMRGCASYIMKIFLPFYLISIVLLVLTIVINKFELSYFDYARVVCYNLIVALFTICAFITPVYFAYYMQYGDLEEEEEEENPNQYEGIDNEEMQDCPTDVGLPPSYDSLNYVLRRRHRAATVINRSRNVEMTSEPKEDVDDARDGAKDVPEVEAIAIKDIEAKSLQKNAKARLQHNPRQSIGSATKKSKGKSHKRK